MFTVRNLIIKRSYATTTLSPLETSLRSALKLSMKAKTTFRTTVIKSLLADLQTASHLPSPPSPSKTLSRSIASRLDGSAIFLSAQPPRNDLSQTYLEEAAILTEFVIEEAAVEGALSADELDAVVRQMINEAGGAVNLGKMIKSVVGRVGEKASGKAVAEAVKKALI